MHACVKTRGVNSTRSVWKIVDSRDPNGSAVVACGGNLESSASFISRTCDGKLCTDVFRLSVYESGRARARALRYASRSDRVDAGGSQCGFVVQPSKITNYH